MRERHDDWQPNPGVVAGLTCVGSYRMSGRFVPGAVTTSGGASTRIRLIMGKRQYQGQPVGHRMAALAQFRGLRMVWIFARNATGETIVTSDTGAVLPRHPAVIETD
jgi:hypothetical protein